MKKETFLSARSAENDLVISPITGATQTVADHLVQMQDEFWREQQ